MKKKTCKKKTCSNPVWGGGFCYWHQNRREDDRYLRRKQSDMAWNRRYSTLRKITTKTAAANREEKLKDDIFYKSIWDKRIHRCEICGTALGSIMRKWFFHHILEKGTRAYAHLRYEKENIILVCKNHHDQFHSANRPQNMILIQEKTKEHFQSISLL